MTANEPDRVAREAARDGVIHRHALRTAGLTDRQIALRVCRQELIRIHRGVYLIGGAPLTFRARIRAALLACGPHAVASHWTAAYLWGVLTLEALHVTLLAGNCGRPSGITVHRLKLTRRETRQRDGLRCTSPARTVCDLAAIAPRRHAERALQEAAVRHLITDAELDRAASIMAGRPGVTAARALAAAEAGAGFTRSGAERELLRLITRAGLPRPEKDLVIDGYRTDFGWPQQRLIVELDGAHTHTLAPQFEADRARDAHLTANGWRILRFTVAQLRHEPLIVIARLSQALAGAA